MTGTVIVTGSAGFVGQHLIKELSATWPQATVVGFDLPSVDITKPETYRTTLKELQPNWLVHLAGIAAVGDALQNPNRVFAVNTEGTRLLLTELASHSPTTRVLAISSSDVYGGTVAAQAGEPIPELPREACVPRNPYAESKLRMETLIAEDFASQPIVIVRPFAHIGPGQQLGFVTADFAAQIAAIEQQQKSTSPHPSPTLGEGDIMKVGNLEAQRDFTDVRDVVTAYRLLMEHGQPGETYNVASGTAVSIEQVLNELIALSEADITIKQDPAKLRPSEVPRLTGDASKLKQLTGWQPTILRKQSLSDILDYWRAA